MKTIRLSFLLLISAINLFGVNQLTVGDPRNSWMTNQGTIEEASLTVQPKGLFMEYGLYLTFSSRGTSWTAVKDTLEVTLKFDLPADAIVYDSWLWIGNDIVKAKLTDRWSASAIYENIVKRRRDPSILSKQSATQYELRIFPMAGNQTRKVKISYLMPVTWNKNGFTAALPIAIINTSKNLPVKFPIYNWPDPQWSDPEIVNDTETLFTVIKDTSLGEHFEAVIPSTKYKNPLSIGFKTLIENGLYFSKYQQGNDGIYQFALFPTSFLNSTSNKKAAILIDYDASNSNLAVKDILTVIKNEMLLNLSNKDSFNLLFSNLSIKRYSEKWVAATKTNIETAFNSLTNPLSSYSNLGTLLANGIDFIKKNGNNGKIILISNSSQYGDYKVGNTLISDISSLMNPKIQIHISDYQSINFRNYYVNGQYYYGNEYFYSNLSRITFGSYHGMRSGLNISEAIDESFKSISGTINSFDLHTSLAAGFCYGRYNINGESNVAYINTPIMQVGKFKGEFPFTIEISGEYNNEIFSKKIEIQNPNNTRNDSIFEEIWTGAFIKKLESGPQSNDIINEIVFTSINERVLSKYTTFLCLEPNAIICTDCMIQDVRMVTEVNDVIIGQDNIRIYPNPFTDRLTIDLNCSDPGTIKELSIYDIKGSLIYQFTAGQIVKGKNVLVWNGNSSNGEKVKPGVYLLSYKTNTGIKTIKIIKK